MIGDTILIFNTIIFSLGAYYLGLEIAMYSILTYFAASKAIDFLVFGLDEHISMMIVTEKNKAIKDLLLSHSQKGVTVLKGQGGFSNQDKDILFCVMTRFELGKIKPEILKQDPNAFIITHKISFSTGGLIKQHHTMGG